MASVYPPCLPDHLNSRMSAVDIANHMQYRSHQRHAPRDNYRRENDLDKFTFWPRAMALGSLVGRQFHQTLGLECYYGEEPQNRARTEGGRRPQGLSYVAFDFRHEKISIKANFKVMGNALPKALRPMDAELSFDDIASEGIHLQDAPHPQTRTLPHGGVERLWRVTMTISTRRPPKFYTAFEHDGIQAMSNNNGRRKGPFRRRATALDFAETDVVEVHAGPLKSIPEGPCAYPTFWNTYRWTFTLNEPMLNRLRQCGQKFARLAEQEPDMHLLSPTQRTDKWLVNPLNAQTFQKMYSIPDMSNIRFSTRCLMEGLIAHGIVKPGEIQVLNTALQQHAVVPAFRDRILTSLFQEERIRNVAAIVGAKARYLRQTEPPGLDHLVMIRTVLVTPTRVLVGAPQQEPSNSVTRRYHDKLDGIIRVQFADEEDHILIQDYTRQCDNLQPNIGMMARIRRTLQHGVVVGGQTFYPVASSASQQKDHALWFIDTRMIDGNKLRAWMGNVEETIIAKHAARMGLPFSSSQIVELDINLGKELSDVKRGQYCFTDGVGIAGPGVMKMAAKALGSLRGVSATPSAIQFRLGGAKGVLTCWPALAGENEVRLRPSLIKFKSKLCDLNVVRVAKHQVAFLNRQFILIMHANGVPADVITEIFSNAIKSIRGMRQRVENATYTRDDIKLWAVCSDFPLSQLIKAGFYRDPLVLDIVSIIETRALQDLKWRARVKLDSGVYLIGVADESGLLEEGQLFCQFQEDSMPEPKLVTGEVLICRAPALHPGDVRRAWAIDCPALRHLKNVIVFNTKGERDLPNMLGGGDLDGDDYTLIWDQRFVKNLRVVEPMDYTAPEPDRVNKVTQAHLNENFVKYILNDILGQVDNTHLALSDSLPSGPYHPDCILLAETHSIAVDFAKTGKPASMDPRLRPAQFPDFMDKEGTKDTYQSAKLLGQLFRLVQPDPHFRPSDIRAMRYPVDQRIAKLPIYDSLIQRLKHVKAQYEDSIQNDMRRYRVSEPEIPSSIAVRNKRRKRARDQNLNEPLHDAYTVHVATARKDAQRAMEDIPTSTRPLTGMQVIARHAYALTFEKEYVVQWEAEQKRGMWGGIGDIEEGEIPEEYLRHKPMTSFAWVFWQELVQIVTPSSANHEALL